MEPEHRQHPKLLGISIFPQPDNEYIVAYPSVDELGSKTLRLALFQKGEDNQACYLIQIKTINRNPGEQIIQAVASKQGMQFAYSVRSTRENSSGKATNRVFMVNKLDNKTFEIEPSYSGDSSFFGNCVEFLDTPEGLKGVYLVVKLTINVLGVYNCEGRLEAKFSTIDNAQAYVNNKKVALDLARHQPAEPTIIETIYQQQIDAVKEKMVGSKAKLEKEHQNLLKLEKELKLLEQLVDISKT